METLQPSLKSGRNTWDRINMPVEELTGRVEKIRRKMEEAGIDLLFLYGHGFNEYGNYCYVSNTVVRLPQGAMVALPAHGEPTLMFEGASRGVPSVKKMTWIDDVRATGDVSRECVNYLQERTPARTIGVAGMKTLMPHHQWQYFSQAIAGTRMIDADPLLRELRMIKSPLEVMQIRRSARIVGAAFAYLMQTSFTKPYEKLIEAAMRREARLEGAEDFRMMIARPADEKWSFQPPGERPIGSDETVLIHLAVEFEKYWAEAFRTVTYREPSFNEPPRGSLHDVSAEIHAAFLPGKRVSQFYGEAMKPIEASKPAYIRDYGLGQGIGLSPREFPVLRHNDDTILQEGMTLSLRLGFVTDERGVVMEGDTFHINKRGCEILTR